MSGMNIVNNLLGKTALEYKYWH